MLLEGRDATVCLSTTLGHSRQELCSHTAADVTTKTGTHRPGSAGSSSGLSVHRCRQPPRRGAHRKGL